jgi:hypothetical protein
VSIASAWLKHLLSFSQHGDDAGGIDLKNEQVADDEAPEISASVPPLVGFAWPLIPKIPVFVYGRVGMGVKRGNYKPSILTTVGVQRRRNNLRLVAGGPPVDGVREIGILDDITAFFVAARGNGRVRINPCLSNCRPNFRAFQSVQGFSRCGKRS